MFIAAAANVVKRQKLRRALAAAGATITVCRKHLYAQGDAAAAICFTFLRSVFLAPALSREKPLRTMRSIILFRVSRLGVWILRPPNCTKMA